jgi:hypothetical protein
LGQSLFLPQNFWNPPNPQISIHTFVASIKFHHNL